ncbi:MAG: biopolymer transporter ExbD [Verrucomicrobiae bacterium]|nr:biopolymer transporter ExbD [Verrucomicrobiae bacterium]MCP5542201.1 biopolymer transporter ExbD [Akkermansiaceae bacterium]
MKFFSHRRAIPAVPIVSLIDILAILLIFFIATTTFKKRQSLVNVNLPQSSEMASSAEKVERLALSLTEDGQIYLGDQAVEPESLAEALRIARRTDPAVKFELKADQVAQIGLLVKVWDAAKKAGVEIDDLPVRILLQRGGGGQ